MPMHGIYIFGLYAARADHATIDEPGVLCDRLHVGMCVLGWHGIAKPCAPRLESFVPG